MAHSHAVPPKGAGQYLRSLALAAALALVAHEALAQGVWTLTGNMASARRDHTATLLADGRVLIIGGFASGAEIFDPASATFSAAGAPLFSRGQGSSATRLADGRVLIVGGAMAAAAEIYDPATGTFAPTGSLNVGRVAHTATLLADGRVLIAGGQDNAVTQSYASAEIFDPATGAFASTGSMSTDRSAHTAVRLPDGRVLVAGGTRITQPGYGICLASVEIFEPASGAFASAGDMGEARCSLYWSPAQLLGNGKVLLVGGLPGVSGDLFDPSTGTFSPTGPLAVARGAMAVSMLPHGHVVIAGGYIPLPDGSPGTTNSAEVYDPATNAFTVIASMGHARQQATATLLPDGRVLVAGGFDFATGGDLASAELLSIAPPVMGVSIDVRPGDPSNTVNPRSRGMIPVAILGTPDFDATALDVATLQFGTGLTPALHPSVQDVNGDAVPDLLVHFRADLSGIRCADTQVGLTGRTLGGQAVQGSDSIRTVGCR